MHFFLSKMLNINALIKDIPYVGSYGIMLSMNGACMSSVWTPLTNQWALDLWPHQEGESCWLHLTQGCLNLAHKTVIAIAILVAAVVTPFLLLIDGCGYIDDKATSKGASLPMERVTRGRAQSQFSTILDFYGKGAKTNQGVTFEQVLAYDDRKLESEHNYIQWLFPLTRKGMHPSALTNGKTMRAFKERPELRKKMLRAFNRMLQFYGFERSQSGTIEESALFAQKAQNWLTPNNHNHLRITRILTSLRKHGLENEAKQFFQALDTIYQKYPSNITERTFHFWKNAAQ